MVKVLHNEGVAIQIGPESCADGLFPLAPATALMSGSQQGRLVLVERNGAAFRVFAEASKSDRQVNLCLPPQLAGMYDAQKAVPPASAASLLPPQYPVAGTRAVKSRNLLPRSLQIKHPIHPDKNMTLENQLLQGSGNRKFQLRAGPLAQQGELPNEDAIESGRHYFFKRLKLLGITAARNEDSAIF